MFEVFGSFSGPRYFSTLSDAEAYKATLPAGAWIHRMRPNTPAEAAEERAILRDALADHSERD
jgi:hypothetical protein